MLRNSAMNGWPTSAKPDKRQLNGRNRRPIASRGAQLLITKIN
jgi:hypothetical protein